ncbi:dienelactone hydrolase family protein [Arthrobacter jiangjiafuii]|uniref:Dienelactone hydrolase family protein n=1 Tax=Arthrobacter jiangjiafuii TaxID=2817475 RepID=A0A975M4Q9_9MICC|nr:dienelactone hydrolase family protein [Arthrobacter jiangjiafuii]MBP3042289.1 dienelactone hydrolase family protein [Arthrobacter jiangjiafuii]QWC09953.1 dienelactone hydrolase family protein [Arthrobacter jiangjiafuii]
MANVLLFHHAQGLTSGMDAFADVLRGAGHTVTVPDLYDGHTFAHLDDGVAYAQELGLEEIEEAGVRIAGRFPPEMVYIGFSLGVLCAQRLAQTRPGARGAVLVSACMPLGTYADSWPDGVPVQIHGMDADPIFVEEGDLSAAENLVEATGEAELILYPGISHLFADIALADYDESAAPALTARVLELLTAIDAA